MAITLDQMKATTLETSAGPKTWLEIYEKASKLANKAVPVLGSDPISQQLFSLYSQAVLGAKSITLRTRNMSDQAGVVEVWNDILTIMATCKTLEAKRAK